MTTWRALTPIALGAALSLVAGPLAAQWTGTRMGGNAKKSDPGEVMQIAAQCVAKRGPAYAFEILETLPGSDEEFRVMRGAEGDIGNCMDNSRKAIGSWQMSFTPRSFRRALANELVLHMLRGNPDTSALSEGDSWFVAAVDAAPEGTLIDAAYLAYMDFGDCVVTRDPASAIAYLQSDPNSKNETVALKQLTPALPPCISAGEQFELSNDSLRLALAEPLYHRLRRLESGS